MFEATTVIMITATELPNDRKTILKNDEAQKSK